MKSIFEQMKEYGCEEIHFRYDEKTGLRAIVAIHSTRLSDVTSGGVRLVDYGCEEDALSDALRLSRAMTQKCAAAGLDLGGSKAVIWNSPGQKTPELLKVFAKFVLDLGGRFRTAVDFGLSHEDGRIIKSVCPYIEGESDSGDGFDSEADTTALGILTAMKAAVKDRLNKDSLEGLSVGVQGVGYVGGFLVDLLLKEKAVVTAADTDSGVVERLEREWPEVRLVSPDKILSEECQVLAPCALGAVLNERTIPRLACSIVCGAANNQLEEPNRDMELLERRNILYLPDFIINAGGIIQAVVEIGGGTKDEARLRTQTIIGQKVEHILRERAKTGRTPLEIANRLVEEALTDRGQ